MRVVHLENTCIEKVEGMSLHSFAFACFLQSKFLSSHYVIRSVSNSDMGEKGSPRQANTGRGHSKTFFCNRFLTGRHLANSGEAKKTLCTHSSYLSQPPQTAVVYFFLAGVLFSRENAKCWPNLANFDQFWLFCREFTEFFG